MQSLEQWLLIATRGLCESAAGGVRDEIGEHYRSALEAAGPDVDPLEVERRVVSELGDATIANREYRRVLLTESEEVALRRLTSKPYRVWGVIATLLLAAAVVFIPASNLGYLEYLWTMTVISAAMRAIPIASSRVGRIVRTVRWGVLAIGLTMSIVAALDDRIGYVPAIIFVLGSVIHTEYRLSVIRRKLPVEQWPKRLWV